jgi:hypothetical protein
MTEACPIMLLKDITARSIMSRRHREQLHLASQRRIVLSV